MNEKSVCKKARVGYIDLFRSFGIVLMIMGHIKFGSYFDKWIHAFHMPMFFFVSGWFFRSGGNIRALLAKKIRTLLLPYVSFEFVQLVFLMMFIPEYRSAQTLLYIFTENTYKIPIGNGTFGISPIPGAMWFLTAIFFTEVIYILLDRILGCNWRLNVTVIVIVIIGMFANLMLSFRLPWALDAGFVGVGFFHIARVVRGSMLEKYLTLKLWQTLLILVAFSVSIMITPKINMRTGCYGWFFPFWVNSLGAIVAGWSLSRFVENTSVKRKAIWCMVCWLKSVGKNSVVYLCLNQTVILAVTKAMNIIGFNGEIAKIGIFLFSMIILSCMEKLICNTSLKVIIGK